MRRKWTLAVICLILFAEQSLAEVSLESRHVYTGRIEAVSGEVDVVPQMAGVIQELSVVEGQKVKKGEVLAVLEAQTEKAQMDLAESRLNLARARLAQVEAGPGNEEIKESYFQAKSAGAELSMAQWELDRYRKLRSQKAVSEREFQECEHKAEALRKKVESLQKRYEAMKRGALPEEISVAKSAVLTAEKELEVAKVKYGYRLIKAPFEGTVLKIYRHTGDSVKMENPTPILHMADTSHLRIRVEVNETDIYRIKVGMAGTFAHLGSSTQTGELVVKEILPLFGPKRLFDPDTSSMLDTRTIQILCDIKSTGLPLYCGQKVIVTLTNKMIHRRDAEDTEKNAEKNL